MPRFPTERLSNPAAVPRLVILIGLPGSGKSTLARSLLMQRSRRLISTDRIRAELFGDESIQGPWSLIWNRVQVEFREAVQQSLQGHLEEAIFDATNAVRRHRRAVMDAARQNGFVELIGLWVDTPLPVCLERNQKRDRQVPEAVIYRMHRCLRGAPPHLDEGWNRLWHYYHFSLDQVRLSADVIHQRPVDNSF